MAADNPIPPRKQRRIISPEECDPTMVQAWSRALSTPTIIGPMDKNQATSLRYQLYRVRNSFLRHKDPIGLQWGQVEVTVYHEDAQYFVRMSRSSFNDLFAKAGIIAHPLPEPPDLD